MQPDGHRRRRPARDGAAQCHRGRRASGRRAGCVQRRTAVGRRRCCGSACWRWRSRYCCTPGGVGAAALRRDRATIIDDCARNHDKNAPARISAGTAHVAGALAAAVVAMPLQAQTSVNRRARRARPDRAPEAAGGQRQAGTHAQAARARARLHAGVGALAARAGRGRPVRRVGPAEPRLRPVGRDQQLIDFERPLSRSEAASLREKLMARPDVEWVEPNLREKRLQATPSDPLFSQQWWLQPVSGSNANVARGAPARRVRLPDRLAARQPRPGGGGGARHRHHQPPRLWPAACSPGYDFVSVLEYANDGNGRDADPSDPGDYVSARRPCQSAALPAARSSAVPGTAPSSPAWSRPTADNGDGRRRHALGRIDPAGARGRQVRRRRARHRRRHALGRGPAGGRRAA